MEEDRKPILHEKYDSFHMSGIFTIILIKLYSQI